MQIFLVAFAVKQFRDTLLQAVCDLFQLFSGLVGGENDRVNRARFWRFPRLCSRLGFFLFRRGFVLFQLIRGGAFRLREAHNAVFARYVIFPPVVPRGKGVAVVVDIALLRKLSPVFLYSVPPVFLVLEIFLCFFGQLQFVQLVNEVIAVVGFGSDSGVYPVAVKVLCKVDKVFHAPGVFPQRYRRREFIPVAVVLHFQELSKIIQLVNGAALYHGKRHVKGVGFCIGKAIDKKVLRVFRCNADAFHSGVKLLRGGRHG